MIWDTTCDFQQCCILTCVGSNEPLQPPFKLRNSKWGSVRSLTIKNSKWVWSGNTTITNCRQPRGTVRKSRSTITRHQEDKLSKAISSLFFKDYSSDQQRLWSDCAYAQADLRLCWSHIPHCWKSHVAAHIYSSNFIGLCYISKWHVAHKNNWNVPYLSVSKLCPLDYFFQTVCRPLDTQ